MSSHLRDGTLGDYSAPAPRCADSIQFDSMSRDGTGRVGHRAAAIRFRGRSHPAGGTALEPRQTACINGATSVGGAPPAWLRLPCVHRTPNCVRAGGRKCRRANRDTSGPFVSFIHGLSRVTCALPVRSPRLRLRSAARSGQCPPDQYVSISRGLRAGRVAVMGRS
jgi:hypothetical protein